MKFMRPDAEIYVPDQLEVKQALARTTHLAIGAHHDDLEIMAIDGILTCYQQPAKWFTGVVVTDGSGSPRTGIYADYSNEEMRKIRVKEQKRAAHIGDYAAQIFLEYASSAVKDRANSLPVEDIMNLVKATQPDIIYTHNLADKHPTHVGVAVKLIQALRTLPDEFKPKMLYGCEVWRDLGWMLDGEKIVFNCSERPNLQSALLGVFDSQISGGKRYDLATMGRRIANATFFTSHDSDQATGLSFAMDLMPLIDEPDRDIQLYVKGYIDQFANDVSQLLGSVL